jgi:hypothetical protein
VQAKYTALFAAVALVAGLAIGLGGAIVGYRRGILPIPGERPFQRMARVLELNPTQREQIHGIMQDTRTKIEAARESFEQQKHKIFFNAYLRIHALLTPSQQQAFDSRFVPPSIRAQGQQRLQNEATPMSSGSPGAN